MKRRNINKTLATHNEISPIFVIGAPRSGTSILTWCLGQHPDVLATEESNWMTDFSVYSAVAFGLGSARGDRSQLSTCGIGLSEFLSAMGKQINHLITHSYNEICDLADRQAIANPNLVTDHIKVAKTDVREKRRWVDGTPEYSLQIPALISLFPNAKFVHIVRDPRLVASSLVRLENERGQSVVQSIDEAYDYWLRCVSSCTAAESAWGSSVVCRVFYQDLVENSRAVLGKILRFCSLTSGESEVGYCTDPLRVRINSSYISKESRVCDEADQKSTINDLTKLYEELLTSKNQIILPNQHNIEIQLDKYRDRVDYVKNLDAEYELGKNRYWALHAEYLERTHWAQSLDAEIREKDQLIRNLQQELHSCTQWALSLDAELTVARKLLTDLKKHE